MARSKKTEEKAKEGATLSIDVDSFVRTRDSVVTGLATLQDAIQTLSTAYIKHTNAVLGEHGAGAHVETALARLGDNPLLGGLGNLNARAATPLPSAAVTGPAAAAATDASDKKERKKRAHDPNAPKRPLTPYFLYMQTARPIIAQDLGTDAAKGAVSLEGTRRWGTMEAEAKQLWTNAYKDNLRLYNARMHSYRAGNLAAKDMPDQDALTYADEHNIGVGVTADAQLVGEASSAGAALHDDDEDAEGELEGEREPTPPPKTPKTKSRKSRASDKKKDTPGAAADNRGPASSIVPPGSVAAKDKEKEKSPDKKRKRASKKSADEPVATVEKDASVTAAAAVDTPKSAPKPRKKKTKADA